MKSMLKSAVVGAVAAAFVASVAVAQGQGQGPGVQRGRGPGGQGMMGQGGPGGPGRGLMPAVMQDLTAEQRQQVKAIMDEQRGAELGPPADARLRRDLEMELLADAPNAQKIEDLKQQILVAQAEGLSRHIAVQTRVAQVLTPEQRAKARARRAEGPRESRGRRGGGSPRQAH